LFCRVTCDHRVPRKLLYLKAVLSIRLGVEPMKNEALAEWQRLLVQADSETCLDDSYCNLICAANEMLREGVVSRSEWHEQIRQAGAWLVNAIEREQALDGK
jgi:hypothetical protein